jgi:hypothetical protein
LSHKTHHASHCLNCGAVLKGRYCYHCGQDSDEHLDSVWHLVKHFFDDITHYDGKFLGTIKPLLTRPGFITQQFLKGKRASYLSPVRMFIFLNFMFFLLILWMPSVSPDKVEKLSDDRAIQDTLKHELINAKADLNKEVKLDKHVTLNSSIGYSNIAEYDSAQQALAPDKRDGRLRNYTVKKWITLLQSIKRDPHAAGEKITEVFLHNSPKLTFLFIIVCSALLYLLYYRRHISMVNHSMFSIHLACTFLLLAIAMLLVSYFPMGNYLAMALFIYGTYYFFRALRVVYDQSFGKTMVKFVIISFFLVWGMAIGLVINALFAFMSIV